MSMTPKNNDATNCNNVSNREFQYRLSRLNARESSSIGLATIASSASLVLLGISFSLSLDALHITELTIIGVSFICLGFAYNEVTCRTILKNDNDFFKPLQLKKQSKLIFRAKKARLFLSRSLLLLPIIGWIFVNQSLKSCWIPWVIMVVIAIIMLVITHPNLKSNKNSDESNPES